MTPIQPLKLVFFGSGDFGLPTLRKLAELHDVILVVSQPDRPAGRKRTVTPTPISHFAQERGIEVFTPEKPNEPEAVARIRSAGADAYVVVAYGHKLGVDLLAEVFAINLHGSLLPKYRGAAPINWAMINGEKETGISVITLAQTMDAGAVLATRTLAIDPSETAGELHDRLAELGPEAILSTLGQFQAGSLQYLDQDPALATKAPKMTKADGTVSFDQPAAKVRRRVHGLTPWPGCTIRLAGSPIKLLRVEVVDEASQADEAGAVRADLTVACRPGAVRLLEVQPAGGRVMSFETYCHGHQVPAGSRCESL